MIYTLPRLLYVRIVGIERPAMSAHGQAGTLADAIGMQLIAIYLSAYRLVLHYIVLACDASPPRISVHSTRTTAIVIAVGGIIAKIQDIKYPFRARVKKGFMVFRRTAEVTCSVNNRGSLSSSSHSGIDRHSSLPSKPSTIECRHHLPVELQCS
jgi:hypothetical protein